MIDVCVRTGDQDLIRLLRENAGTSVLAPDNPAMGVIKERSPHRVFLSRLGRVGGPAAQRRTPPPFTRRSGIELSIEATPGALVRRPTRKASNSGRPAVAMRIR